MFLQRLNPLYFEADKGGGAGGDLSGGNDNPKPDEKGGEGDSSKADEKKFSQEELDAILKDRLDRKERKLQEKYADYDDLKKKVEEIESEKEKKEREEMSELERLQKDLEERDGKLSEYEEKLKRIEEERKQDRIMRAFEKEARKANIEFIEDAYKLADIEKIELDDGGNVSGMEEVVKKLVEAKPFLVKKESKQKQIGEPSGTSEPAKGKSDQQILSELAAQARKTGSMKDRLAYVEFKRKIQNQE